jgi:hypothetical protein
LNSTASISKLFLTLAETEIAKGNLDKAALNAGRVAELSIKHRAGALVEAQLEKHSAKGPPNTSQRCLNW